MLPSMILGNKSGYNLLNIYAINTFTELIKRKDSARIINSLSRGLQRCVIEIRHALHDKIKGVFTMPVFDFSGASDKKTGVQSGMPTLRSSPMKRRLPGENRS